MTGGAVDPGQCEGKVKFSSYPPPLEEALVDGKLLDDTGEEMGGVIVASNTLDGING